jgi:TetR/AcrR family transcriptional regulator, cholesterol catabolism regulator
LAEPGAAATLRPARRGEGTRAAIEAAAVERFARLGYHATSMREIAAAAQVRPAAIYHWYPSKEAILVRLQDDFMEQLTARVEAAVARQERPALRLAGAVHAHVVFHCEHPLEAFVTDSEIRALTPGPRAALVAQRDAYQARFAALIRAGLRDGSLHSSDPRVATYSILLQCTGVGLWFRPDGPLGAEQVGEIHVELVLGALGADRALVAEAIAGTTGGA